MELGLSERFQLWNTAPVKIIRVDAAMQKRSNRDVIHIRLNQSEEMKQWSIVVRANYSQLTVLRGAGLFVSLAQVLTAELNLGRVHGAETALPQPTQKYSSPAL